jgi:TRAP-type mannitol/chloroaromatic compound transport system substrate-binding protein
LARLQELYANKFNVIQFPAGNTGVQMGGWFRKEINTPADLQGLKMRISGVGGQIMAKLGVNVQVLPAAEIFQALQTGAIDAAEWVGPYDDEKLGLNKAAEFYYTPAWWEPGPSLEIEINLDEWKKLPEIYQAIIQNAAAMANVRMLSSYEAKNVAAMKSLIDGGTQVREYSPEIMDDAQTAAGELFDEYSAQDADFKAIFAEWDAFRKGIQAWNRVNEFTFSNYIYGGAD